MTSTVAVLSQELDILPYMLRQAGSSASDCPKLELWNGSISLQILEYVTKQAAHVLSHLEGKTTKSRHCSLVLQMLNNINQPLFLCSCICIAPPPT